MRDNPKCCRCHGPATKVIYAGAPGVFCQNEECACLSGMASYVGLIYFNGAFMSYTGSYWRALWHFVKGDWLQDAR